MKREVGVWIDQTKAIIVTMIGEKQEIRQVRSNIEKHIRFSGGTLTRPLYGTALFPKPGHPDQKFSLSLSAYYDGVVALIRNADAIWIFGPGDAKAELEKCLQREQLAAHIVGIETVDKMTDREIAEKVRQHYQK